MHKWNSLLSVVLLTLQFNLLIVASANAQDNPATVRSAPGKTFKISLTNKLTLEKLVSYTEHVRKMGIDLRLRTLDFDRRGRLDNIRMEVWLNGKYQQTLAVSSLAQNTDRSSLDFTIPLSDPDTLRHISANHQNL